MWPIKGHIQVMGGRGDQVIECGRRGGEGGGGGGDIECIEGT